mmetsp:Transcript_29687/g.74692  ORF Transcript_29687/g.74692 Transcript_29687/m.74692 type:complete len:173 (-) Transcript_29687:297-815(-)
MGIWSVLGNIGKIAPPPGTIVKGASKVPVQATNQALKAMPPPAILKTTPPSALETGGKLVVNAGQTAKKSTIGLMVGGGAAQLLGGKQLRAAISDVTGMDFAILETPGQLLTGALDGIEGFLAAAAGVAITVGAAYVTWFALGAVPIARRLGATAAATAAVGLGAASLLETV